MQILGRKFNCNCSEGFQLTSTRDQNNPWLLTKQPCERYLNRRRLLFFCSLASPCIDQSADAVRTRQFPNGHTKHKASDMIVYAYPARLRSFINLPHALDYVTITEKPRMSIREYVTPHQVFSTVIR